MIRVMYFKTIKKIQFSIIQYGIKEYLNVHIISTVIVYLKYS